MNANCRAAGLDGDGAVPLNSGCNFYNGMQVYFAAGTVVTAANAYLLVISDTATVDSIQAQVKTAQTLVQNRVSLAMPVLSAVVQNEGISVRKKSPEPLLT